MLKTKLFKGALAVSAVTALFAALAVQAQTGGGTAGTSGAGQTTTGTSTGTAGGQSGSGQSGSSSGQSGSSQSGGSQAGTGGSASGQSGTGQSGSGQSGSGQSTSGQSGSSQAGAGSGSAQSGTSHSGSGQTAGQSTSGHGASHTASRSGNQAGSSTASGSGAMGGPALSRADQKLIKDMAMANLSEIEASRMAQGKTQSDQVKNFAQQMIDDHTKALGEVQQLAQAKGVALPTELDRTHKRKAERMAAMSGDAFDRAYMNQAGVADHKMTHSLLQKVQSRAKDPDVKALAARTMPIVDQHLSSAQQLHRDTARGSSHTQGSTGSSSDRK